MSQYTSESEFNLEKRVHITNEIPPYDMFDALNSVMQTTIKNGEIVPSIWQWILGYTKVEYDLPYLSESYNEDTDSIEYSRDIDNEAVYYKMVNGELAEEYGPKPKTTKEGIETKYHRLEEYGVLLPEFDFLLHEGYRYLSTIYPDHPDFTKLLTTNEFNDFISQAAAIIDYEPNNLFFDKLVSSLGLEGEDALKEAAMCKIRNLRNEAYRRKLYGSKFGYRMLANELLYTVTVFPVATYLPLRPIKNDKARDQLEIYGSLDKLNQWNLENSQNLSANSYIKYIRQHDRKIDTFSKNYYKKLRLIDYDGSSSKYTKADKNIRFFGLVTPFNEYTICEYPAQSDTTTSIAKVRNGLQCSINDRESFVTEVNPDKSCVSLAFENGKVKEVVAIDKEHHSFNVTSQQKVDYKDLFIYPSFEETMCQGEIPNKSIAVSTTTLLKTPIMQEIYSSTYYKDLDFIKSIKATINPTYCDTVVLCPSETLNFYPTDLEYDKDDGYSSSITWNDSPISVGNILSTDKVLLDKTKVVNEAVEVVGFTKGSITFTPTAEEKERTLSFDSHSQFIKEDERYAIVVKTNKNKKVILLGGLSIYEEIENSLYAVNKIKFNIGAIPETKNDKFLSLVYGKEYEDLVKEITSLEEQLNKIEIANSIDRNTAKLYIDGDQDVKRLLESSGIPYQEYISLAEKYFELQDTLDDMSKNREHLFAVVDENEEAYLNNECEVVGILIGSSGNGSGAYSEYTGLPLGYISSISLGNLNVVSIISNGVVIDSDEIGFQMEGLNYFPVLKDIYKLRTNENQWSQYYSHTTDLFKDNLVGYEKSNAVCFDYDRTLVQIESTIDTSTDGKEYIISFESDLAKELSKTLSVGDIVTGPTIDSDDEDVFITSVGDGYVTVSKELQLSGEFVLNYLVKTNITIDDTTDDISLFKQDLYDNGLYEEFNPFKHGLYPSAQWPNVSEAVLDSLADISLFDLHNVKGQFKTDEDGEYELDSNGEKIKVNKDTFTVIMEEVYADLYSKILTESNDSHRLLMPADIKFNNELFVEFNLNKLLDYPSIEGVRPILMSVDWLDYMSNSLEYSSKATDKVSIGTNLMMETDTSGYYTLISGQKYTDPNTRVRFITMNLNGLHQWPEVSDVSDELTIPVYAQIGTGGNGRSRWFKNIDDVTYPNVWGVSVYDDYKSPRDIKDRRGNIIEYGYDENSEFYKEGGELRRVSVYGQTFETNEEDVNSDYFRNIENPIMEIPLGEYDTVARYSNKETGSGLLTITNVSFYKQTFEGLLKYFDNVGTNLTDDCRLQILGSDMSGVSLLEPLSYKTDAWYYESEGKPTARQVGLTNSNISFLSGVSISKTEDNKISIPRVVGNRTLTITDTSVLNGVQVKTDSNGQPMTSKDSITFEKGSVLVKYDETWFLKKFQFCGLIGDGLDFTTPDGLKGYITSNTNFAPFPSTDSTIDPDTNKETGISSWSREEIAEYLGVLTDDVPEDFALPTEGINLFERLLQYLIRVDTDIPSSNLTYLNYYSYLSGNGVAPTEVRAGDESTLVHNLSEVFALRDTVVSDGKTIKKPLMTLTENTDTGFVLEEDNVDLFEGYIPFFTYVGGGNYKKYFEKYGIKIEVGDSICILNVGRCDSTKSDTDKPYKWQLYKLNRNCMMGLSVPMKKYGNTTDTEYAAAIGDTILEYKYTDTEGKQWPVYADTSSVSITNKIDSANSNFTLPRRFVTEGSYDFKFTIDPKFVGEGYPYKEDGTIDYSSLCSFYLTKGSIYYDQDNDAFYMYSRDLKEYDNFNQDVDDPDFGNKLSKFAIKFNEQKYFKNVLNTYCVYQLKDSLESDTNKVVSTPTLSSLEDIPFNLDKIDVGDRLLKVEKIDLRSIYNRALEPVLFSNYLDVDYSVRGITDDGRLYVSYIGQPDNSAERVSFAISLDKLLPTKFNFDEVGGSYSVVNYHTDNIDFVNDNKILYDAPTMKNVRITKPLTQDSFNKPAVNREFIYYKNTLPFKAAVNLASPSTLIIPSEDRDYFEKAIAELGVGDSLVSAYVLGDSPFENKLAIKISCNGSVIDSATQIVSIKFVKNMFMAVTKDGIAYYNYNCDISSVSDVIECKTATLSTSKSQDSFSDSQTVHRVDFDYDTDTWLVEVKEFTDNSSLSSIYGFTTEDTPNEASGILYMTPMFNDEAAIITYEVTQKEGQDPVRTTIAAFGSEFNSNTEKEIEIGNDKVAPTTDIEEYLKFTNSVVSGLAGETYTTNVNDVREVESELNLVFVKDIALRRGTLKLNKQESTENTDFYESEEPLSCGPYLVDTMELEYSGSRLNVADSINSRAFVASDITGNYQLYAKGRNLFIKSPTAIVGKVENPDGTESYEYTGDTTGESYWKYARAPIFSNNEQGIYRSTDTETLEALATDIGSSMSEYLNALSTETAGIMVNNAKINSSHSNALENIKNWMKGYATTATFDQFKAEIDACKKAVEEGSQNTQQKNTSYGYQVVYTHSDTEWSIKLFFPKIDFVERNLQNKLYTSGICSKRMVMIKDGLKYEVDVQLKDDYTDFDYEAAYGDYVYIISKLFGYTLDDSMEMSSKISKAQFTDNKLILLDEQGFVYQIGLDNLTTRADIENINNWSVSSYPSNFVYTYVDSNVKTNFTFVYADANGENIISVPQTIYKRLNTTFKPVCSYIKEDLILLGGYTLSKEQIRTNYENLVGKENVNEDYLNSLLENSEYENLSTPTLLYSVDGGISFNKANLPSLGDGVSLSYYITSIRFLNNTYYFYCSTPGDSVFNDSGYVLQRGEEGLYDFRDSIVLQALTDEDKEYGISEQFDIDSSVGMRGRTPLSASTVSNGLTEGTAPSARYRLYLTKNSSYFHLASSKVVTTKDIVVLDKGADFVSLSGNIYPTGSGTLDVLLAFKTEADITNPYRYLNKDKLGNYVNDWGDLKVAEVVQVDGKEYANRFYSYRELLSAEERENDQFGYPAYAEDSDKLYYTYTTIELNEDEIEEPEEGEEPVTSITKVDYMTNRNDAEIKLCDATGNYLFIGGNFKSASNFSNRVKGDNAFDIYDSAYNTKYSSLAEAENDPNARKLDSLMMSLVGTQKIKIDYFSANRTLPNVIVNLGNTVNTITKLRDILFTDDEEFVEYVNLTSTDSVSTLSISSLTYDDNGEEKVKYTKKNYNGTNYWYNNQEKFYPIKTRRFISSKVYMPYTHGGEIRRFTNTSMDNIYKEDSEVDLPITGIFLSNFGYGGTRNNLDLWKYDLPWQKDPAAFETEFVKNVNGDHIYLTDATGNEIISYNSEMYIENGDETSVSREVFGTKTTKDVILSGTDNDSEKTPWEVHTEFNICEFDEPKVFSAYDIDSSGEENTIIIFNGQSLGDEIVNDPITFTEPFFVYKNGRNLYEELDTLENGKKFNVEFKVSKTFAQTLYTGLVDANEWVTINKDTLKIVNKIEKYQSQLSGGLFTFESNGSFFTDPNILGLHITYSYRGVKYTKDLGLSFTQKIDVTFPSPSIVFEHSPVPVVVRKIDYSEPRANLDGTEDVTGKYIYSAFNFNTMTDDNSESFNVRIIPVDYKYEQVKEENINSQYKGYMVGRELVCNNPNAYNLTGPLVYNHGGDDSVSEELTDLISFKMTRSPISAYETRLLNFNIDTFSFEIAIPVVEVGKISAVYYNDWDIKKRAVGQEEKRTREFAVFIGDERYDEKYKFELVKSYVDNSISDEYFNNLVDCKLVGSNFIFDRKVLEDNTETSNNRDSLRIRVWQAYNSITVSNCGNDSAMDYHIIKFPIGLFDTYLGRFVGNGVPGFEGWSVTYNGVDVTSSFDYTFEDNMPYLTSKPHAFDKDGTIASKTTSTTNNVLVLKVNYDYYEDSMTVNVNWNNFYSSPRLVKATPFVLKNIPDERNSYSLKGPYLMSEDITYNTYINPQTSQLVDYDSALRSDLVPLTFELQQTVMPDYEGSQRLLDAFSAIINGDFDTYAELCEKIKGIKYDYTSLEEVWNEVMENFGTAAKYTLGPKNDEEEDTKLINAFKEELSKKTISSSTEGTAKLNDTLDRYVVGNLFELLEDIKEDLTNIKDTTTEKFVKEWMNSNYSDIPTAVENSYQLLNTITDKNGRINFKRYAEDNTMNLANFSDTIDSTLNSTAWANDQYKESLDNGKQILSESTISKTIADYISNPLATELESTIPSRMSTSAAYAGNFNTDLNSIVSYVRNLTDNWKNFTHDNKTEFGRYKSLDLKVQPSALVSEMKFTYNNGTKFTSLDALKKANDTYNGLVSLAVWAANKDKKIVGKAERQNYLHNWFVNKANSTESSFNDLKSYYSFDTITNQDSLDKILLDFEGLHNFQTDIKSNWKANLASLNTLLNTYENREKVTYTEKSGDITETTETITLKDSLNKDTSSVTKIQQPSVATPGTFNEDSATIMARISDLNSKKATATSKVAHFKSQLESNGQSLSGFGQSQGDYNTLKDNVLAKIWSASGNSGTFTQHSSVVTDSTLKGDIANPYEFMRKFYNNQSNFNGLINSRGTMYVEKDKYANRNVSMWKADIYNGATQGNTITTNGDKLYDNYKASRYSMSIDSNGLNTIKTNLNSYKSSISGAYSSSYDTAYYNSGTWSGTYSGTTWNCYLCWTYRVLVYNTIKTYANKIADEIKTLNSKVDGLNGQVQTNYLSLYNACEAIDSARKRLIALMGLSNTTSGTYSCSRPKAFNTANGNITYDSYTATIQNNSGLRPDVKLKSGVGYGHSLSNSYSDYTTTHYSLPRYINGYGWQHYITTKANSIYYRSDWWTYSWDNLRDYCSHYSSAADSAISLIDSLRTNGAAEFYDATTENSKVDTANSRLYDLQKAIKGYYVSGFDPVTLYNNTYVGNSSGVVKLYNTMTDSDNVNFNKKYTTRHDGITSAWNFIKNSTKSYIKNIQASFTDISYSNPNTGATSTLMGESLQAVSLSNIDTDSNNVKDLYKNAWKVWNSCKNTDEYLHSIQDRNSTAYATWSTQLTNVDTDLTYWSSVKDGMVAVLNSIYATEVNLNCRTSLKSSDFDILGKTDYSSKSRLSKTLQRYRNLKKIIDDSSVLEKDSQVIYYKEDSIRPASIPNLFTYVSSYIDTQRLDQVDDLYDKVISESRVNSTAQSYRSVNTIKEYISALNTNYIKAFTWAANWENTKRVFINNMSNNLLHNNIELNAFISTIIADIDSTGLTKTNTNINRYSKEASAYLTSLFNTGYIFDKVYVSDIKSSIENYTSKTKKLYSELYKLMWQSDDVIYNGKNAGWTSYEKLESSYGYFNNILKAFKQYYDIGKSYVETMNDNVFEFNIKDVMDFKVEGVVKNSYEECNRQIQNTDPNVQWQGYIGRIFTCYLNRLYMQNYATAQTDVEFPLDTNMNSDYIRGMYVMNNNGGAEDSQIMSLRYEAKFHVVGDTEYIRFTDARKAEGAEDFFKSPNIDVSKSVLSRLKYYDQDENGTYVMHQTISSMDVDKNTLSMELTRCGAANNVVSVVTGETGTNLEGDVAYTALPTSIESRLKLPLFLYNMEDAEDNRLKRPIKTIVGKFKYYLDTDGEPFVLYNGVDRVTFKVIRLDINLDEYVYISGVEGPVMLRKPKYNTYYELIQNEGYVIIGDTLISTAPSREEKVSADNPLDTSKSLVNFGLKNDKGTAIQLVNKLSSSKEDLNDGETHYIRIKVLTQSTILSEATTCNERDMYEEISLDDLDKFTPDRVWFNELGYPLPPIQIDNNIFNAENNYAFTKEAFKNNNGFSIYRCNSEGKIIGFSMVDSRYQGTIKEEDCDGGVIKKVNGVISKGAKSFILDGTMDLENAQVPNKPKYRSCKDWFKNGFYVQGHEANPFWQILKISSTYNSAKEGWKQYYQVLEYQRTTNSMDLVNVEEGDRYINIDKTVIYKKNGNTSGDIDIMYSEDFVDLKNGKINFTLLRPDDKYRNSNILIKYGITAKNTFSLGVNDLLKDINQNSIWNGKGCRVATWVELNYTVNSTKSTENKIDKNADIVGITELGLFNKNHELIAYAVFPPIEIHSDSQHASFTCYVKNGNLSPLGESEDSSSEASLLSDSKRVVSDSDTDENLSSLDTE